MTRRNFNWAYRTAHPLGRSHVVDSKAEEREFIIRSAVETNEKAKALLRARQQERLDFFKRHPQHAPKG